MIKPIAILVGTFFFCSAAIAGDTNFVVRGGMAYPCEHYLNMCDPSKDANKATTPKEVLKIIYERIKAEVKQYEDKICEETKTLDKLKGQLKDFDTAIDKIR